MARLLIIAYTSYVRDARVKRHAEALAQRGDEVDVICLAGEELRSRPRLRLIGVEIRRYQGSSRVAYLRSYLQFFTRAAAIALRRNRAEPYDAAIVCSMPDAIVLCAAPLKRFGVPLILDVHDTMPELYREKFGDRRGALVARLLTWEERASAWVADRVLAVHELHRIRLEAAGIPADKIHVVVNAPDPAIFFPTPVVEPDDRHFTLVCHGTIARRLGLDLAFEAIELVHRRVPSVRLVVIGRGDYLEQAKRLMAARKLDNHVTFLPPILIEQLPPVLKRADVGIVPNPPSAATHLMLPAKMLEYATLGIPIISARLRTVEHYFEHAVRFFEPGDPRSLAEAIEDLHAHPEMRVELARRASAIAESISWSHQREHLFEAIDGLMASKGRAAAVARALGAGSPPSPPGTRLGSG